ncbi:MAG TPA: molybdopterin cofactor-binding domain-containing protein [Myxococcota bacterium]|jgi:CO/xanthine dehydrogenase Mo-binding subunit|nr:molybdopterin cofactor-binding domain-containing protein [Myxococcota bacterium]
MQGTARSDGGLVGRSVARLDGTGKVTGAALYVDDVAEPSAWFGATIRTRLPKGRLAAVEFDPAFEWSTVVRVTAADLPALGVKVNGVMCLDDTQPVLCDGVIRHAAEPAALVAAPTSALLHEALRHVRLVEEPSPATEGPPLLTLDDALARGAEVLTSHAVRRGDPEAVLAAAAADPALLVLDGDYTTGHQEQLYIETCGMVGGPNPDGPGVAVHGSLQCPYYVHKALKHMFGLAPEQVVVRQDVTGGGFGGKEEYPSMIGAHAVLLGLAAKRPVKIVYERGEDMVATTKRHPARIRWKAAFRRADGGLAAARIDVFLDCGAYRTLSPVVLSRAILHALGPYRCEHVAIDGKGLFTNTPPNGAFRGFGAPQVAWAYERMMDRAAAALGVEPLELRRRHHLREGDVTPTGQVLRWSVGSTAVLDRAEQVAGWTARRAAARAQRSEAIAAGDALRRGVGAALFFHGAGFTGNGEVYLKGRAEVELRSGGVVRVLAATTDIGQGTRTILPQIAAQELGLPLERVEMEDPRTDRVPDSGPTVASRSCMVVGKIVQEAAADLGRQLCRRLEQARGLPEGALARRGAEFFDGEERVAGWNDAAAGAEGLRGAHVYRHPDGVAFDDESYTGDAYPVYGWGADVAEVEVDTDTGEVRVTGIWTAHDVGKAINPMVVAGQIEGGVLQALGWALCEEVVMKDGLMANGRMTNYIIPTALDAPEMVTEIVETAYFHGPFGAKGVGELPIDGPAPAVAAAIEDAIGVHLTALPMTPERVLDAIDAGARPKGAR